jgi:uncharacterized protein (TIGR03437 family)
MRILHAALLCCVLSAFPLVSRAQSWDTSGNSQLNGTYYFRQVVYIPADNNGDLSAAISVFGNITFNGAGGYTIAASTMANDSQYGIYNIGCYLGIGTTSNCGSQTVSGSYSISASGFGFMTSPVSSLTSKGDSIYGMVSNGVFTGSSTETADGYNDLFIAAPVGAGTPNFTGTYSLAGYLPGASAATTADVFFQMSPSGNSLGTVNVSGYYGFNGAGAISQSSSGVKYTTGNGAAIVTFPNNAAAPFFVGSPNSQLSYNGGSSAPIFGPVYLYFSPDGSFCFGGSPDGWDMIVGVRNDSSSFKSGVIYYDAGLDMDTSTLASGFGTLDSYYGSFSSTSGSIIEADRILSPGTAASVQTYGDKTSDTTFFQYAFANSGAVRIGAGIGPYLGLSVALQAPKSPGSGGSVYIDPTSLQNTGSYSPFTSGVSPGELITLYGTNLAAKTVVAPAGAFPKALGGVQVVVNGVAASIYYVSATQLSAIIPYETTGSVASIQVVNGTTASNTISLFLYQSSVGAFSQFGNGVTPGLGYAAAVHNATGQVVTPSNPAQPGEYIALFITGLGTIYPTIQDGAVGPSNPLSASTYCLIPAASSCEISVAIGGTTAPLQFAGLAPTLAGLYQINFQVPTSGVSSGNNNLSICGPDSCTSESMIPVGTGSGALFAQPHARPHTNSLHLGTKEAIQSLQHKPKGPALAPATPGPFREQP